MYTQTSETLAQRNVTAVLSSYRLLIALLRVSGVKEIAYLLDGKLIPDYDFFNRINMLGAEVLYRSAGHAVIP